MDKTISEQIPWPRGCSITGPSGIVYYELNRSFNDWIDHCLENNYLNELDRALAEYGKFLYG